MLYPAELCRHTIFGLLRWRSVTRQSPKSCINAGFVARCLRAKSRFFSLFDHPDRWPIFSIFSRYFFRRKCYLRPLQHLAFLIKILSTEFPSTPEYFSKVLSTGPLLGGERSILLSYRDVYEIFPAPRFRSVSRQSPNIRINAFFWFLAACRTFNAVFCVSSKVTIYLQKSYISAKPSSR